MKLITLLTLILLSGCSTLFAPPAGVHYEVTYKGVVVKVDDWTNTEGVEFEYITGDTTIILKKKTVDTTTPAAVLGKIQAENTSKLIAIAAMAAGL